MSFKNLGKLENHYLEVKAIKADNVTTKLNLILKHHMHNKSK